MAIYAQIGMEEALRLQDESDEKAYREFTEKFKPKKTTDDCLTPPEVFDAVTDWAAREYGFDREKIVRPFWPGADFESFDYPDGCVVCDNPPFSIESRIMDFFIAHGVRFFLFAPSLTLCACMRSRDVTAIVTDADVIYENGAVVKTSFLTNLDARFRIRTAPALSRVIKEACDRLRHEKARTVPRYEYPDSVVSSANLQRIARFVDFAVPKDEAVFISGLDRQRDHGKSIFGGGLLISERAAAERAAAERAAAERAAAERAAAERAPAKRWELSARELGIQRAMRKEKRA